MKKFYSLVLALVAYATTAFATTVTINIDNITRVTIQKYNSSTYDYDPIAGLVNGDNVLTYDTDVTLQVTTTNSADYGLTSITWKQGTETGSESIYSGNAYLNINSNWDGTVYTIKSFAYEDLRTASCKIYVDDASKVSLSRKNYAKVSLQNGVNVVKFIPSGDNAETPFSLSGNSALYAVKINGVEQTESWSKNYNLSVADGDSVTILANFPDVDVPVQFIAGDDKSAGFITGVDVDGTSVTNWADADFSVKLGSKVTFNYNTADYSKDSIFVNGEKINSYGSSYYFTVTTETTHTVKYYAHKYATYDITINIDDPSHITLYKGYSYNNQEITGLVAGKNTVSLSEMTSGISFKAASGCWVESFTDAEGNEYKGTSSYSQISTKAGDVFTITTGAADRSSQFVFYIDSVSKATYGGAITFPDRTSPLVFSNGDEKTQAIDGYNIVNFDPAYDSVIIANFYLGDGAKVYLYINDSLASPKYEGSSQYELRLEDKDIVKAFLAGAPDTLDVTLIETDEYKFIDLTEDVLNEESSLPTNPYYGKALTGTLLSFSVTDGGVVYQDEKKLEPVEDDVYAVVITANTTIEVKAPETAIENTNAALNRNVYTVEGILLLQDATDAQIKSLPAGLYIINGQSTYLLQH